jgi:hypothetical protein
MSCKSFFYKLASMKQPKATQLIFSEITHHTPLLSRSVRDLGCGLYAIISAMTSMKYTSMTKFCNQKSSCQFLRYWKFMYNSYYIRVLLCLNPDVIGIVHGFLISQNLARGFLVSNIFPTQILYRTHC